MKSVLLRNSYEVRVTPNPVTTFVNVYLAKNSFGLSQITVSDANGKLVEKINTAYKTKQINTSRYAKGIYFIKIITGDNVNTQKIIIQ